MEDYDDFNSYNGDLEHDMLVDYHYHLNTGNLKKEYDDDDDDDDDDDGDEELDEYVAKVNAALERIRNLLSEFCNFEEEQNDKDEAFSDS